MKRSLLKIALCLLALVMVGSIASADTLVNVNVTGMLWRVAGNMVVAPTGAPVTSLGSGTFSATGIDFWTPGPQNGNGTLNDFLTNGGASIGPMSNSTLLPNVMSNCFDGTSGGPNCYSTIVRLMGTTTFYQGVTYTLTHDDGAVMFVGSNEVIASAGPTSELASTWTPDATVTSAFTIYYSATNGNPEVLKLTAVPDGGMTLMLLGGVLVGLAGLRRKFRA